MKTTAQSSAVWVNMVGGVVSLHSNIDCPRGVVNPIGGFFGRNSVSFKDFDVIVIDHLHQITVLVLVVQNDV